MLNFIKNYKIRNKILICFLILIIPMLTVLGIFSYLRAEKAILENVSTYVIDTLIQSSKNVDFYLKDADNVTASIIFDQTIREYLYSSREGIYERAVAMTEMLNILSGMIYPRDYIKQLYIIDINDYLFTTNNNIDVNLLKQQEWYQQINSGKFNKKIVPTHDSREYTQGQNVNNVIGYVVTMVREYIDIERNLSLGVIAIDISYKMFEQNFSKINMGKINGEILITSAEGSLIYHQDKTMLGKKIDQSMLERITTDDNGSYINTIDGEKNLFVYARSEMTGWITVGIVPMKYLMKTASDVRIDTLIIGIICIILSTLFSVILSLSISNPIKTLMQNMKTVENGNFDSIIEVKTNDEIGQLSLSFNQMNNKIKKLIEGIYQKEQEKRLAEMHMLQQQINPHFLYNTLDSINWMARMQNASNISYAITTLNKLLRMSIHNGKEYNSITNELECIKHYIVIQKIRFGDSFNIVYDVDEECMELFILKFLIQPLIENALYHGLDLRKSGGIIKLSCKKKQDAIIIKIEDNGKGIMKDEIQRIMLSKPLVDTSFSGIGIKNIIQRISLYYGDLYSLRYSSEVGIGTTAELCLPLIFQPEGEISV